MSVSLGLQGRLADPTVQLRRPPRTSSAMTALAFVLVALAGIGLAILVFVPGSVARGRSGAVALVERLRSGPRPASLERPGVDVPPRAALAVPAPVDEPVVTNVEALPSASLPVAAPPNAIPSSPAAVPASSPTSDASVPSNMTRLALPASAKGHRIFLDGRVVANGGASVTVKCGKHKVRVGSAGKARAIDLPCGGDRSLD